MVRSSASSQRLERCHSAPLMSSAPRASSPLDCVERLKIKGEKKETDRTITAIENARGSRIVGQSSQGAWLGDFLFLSGQLASDSDTGVPKEVRRQAGYPFYGSDIREQTKYVLTNLKAVLEENGSDLAHVVKTQVFLTDLRHFDEFDRVWKSFFDVPPPRTTLGVGETGLEVPGALVEVDVIAVRRDGAQQPQPVTSARIP